MISSTEKSLGPNSIRNSPCTASHSLRSSPSGSFTARRRFPEPLRRSNPQLDNNSVDRTGTHQRRFGVFPELVLLSTLRYIPAWLEGARLSPVRIRINRSEGQIKLLQAEECRHS